MPDGLWVTRTALEVVFTDWPPGPLDRKVSMRRSSSRITISKSVSRSGYTSTEANEVCLLPEASKGEMRMSRWMPDSPLSSP